MEKLLPMKSIEIQIAVAQPPLGSLKITLTHELEKPTNDFNAWDTNSLKTF